MRDELQTRLWRGETFVDFDAGLNKIMIRLREALGDSATNPRFIETVARRGYRLLVPVRQRMDLRSAPNAAQKSDFPCSRSRT